MNLTSLKINQTANIHRISTECEDTLNKLTQLGLYEGLEVTLVNRAPIFRDPITVKIDQRLIGIRKSLASKIFIQ